MHVRFDIIGNKEKAVAIIELPEAAKSKEIAKEIIRNHPNVKSILAKAGPRSGVFRTYKLKLVAGSRNTEVVHQEHGMKFELDPAKVYFSPRESFERQKISRMVVAGERVLVMFAGAGPYGIAIAKGQPKARVEMVELNPAAVKYAEQNVKINGVGLRVGVHCGDARDAARLGKFNRIIMPLPESAWEFLPAAFSAAKKGTIIHLYGISMEKNLFKDLEKKIKKVSKQKTEYRITNREKVLPYAPRTWKVRVDIKTL